jgi:hypothetical protein
VANFWKLVVFFREKLKNNELSKIFGGGVGGWVNSYIYRERERNAKTNLKMREK